MNRPTKLAILAVGAVVALSACAKAHDDAPDPCTNQSSCTPGTNSHVIHEPDGFRNVSFS